MSGRKKPNDERSPFEGLFPDDRITVFDLIERLSLITGLKEDAVVKFYILDGHEPVAVDPLEWARWFATTTDRQVARDEIDNIVISTAFFGLDHNFTGKGDPLLFETMIFGGIFDKEQIRTATWEEAEKVHAKLASLVRKGAEILPFKRAAGDRPN